MKAGDFIDDSGTHAHSQNSTAPVLVFHVLIRSCSEAEVFF